ncbi:MAG: S1C family serine protease [Candidatus Dormibacteraceae bacterium]
MFEPERFSSESPGPPPIDGGPGRPVKAHPRWGPRTLAIGATVALIGVTGALFLNSNTASAGSGTVLSATAPITAVSQPVSAYSGAGVQAQAVAARIDPALVDINTVFQTATASGTAAGTGIIVTSTGEVLTNNHVVEGAASITLAIAGRPGSYTAQVIGVDPTADVALLQVGGVSGLPTATFADSSNLQLGESVIAIGNAGGAGGTPSVSRGGIVALGQSITATGGATPEQLTDMIQTDASIAPGDSGGALVNSAGQVVGMITAGRSRSAGRSTTIGYAIPSSDALNVINQIRAGQASSQIILGQVGYLGISATDLTPAIAAHLGLNLTSGALVVGVLSGSPAEQAGLGRYAVITAIDGSPIASATDLGNVLHAHQPGDQVVVTWTDPASGAHTATVILTTGPAL